MAPGTPEEVAAQRVVTVPNALSVLRLLGVPLFLWLLLGPHADIAALIVLAASGFTDWADGVLARKLNQTSQLGALLDPAADRLYILATLVGLTLRHIIPWWLAAIIVGRDLVLAPGVWLLRRRGIAPLNVSYLGKSATFCLLYAFPLLLIGAHDWAVSDVARPIAWAFVWWGTSFYLLSGVLYGAQVVQVLRAERGARTDSAAGAG